MESSEIKKSIILMEQYNSLNCKTIKELSKQTYKMRESGIDIPYVPVKNNGAPGYDYSYPSPISKQKNWKYIDSYKIRDIKTSKGFTKLQILETPQGLLFLVETRFKTEDDKLIIKIEYSNRVITLKEYKTSIWSGNIDFDSYVVFKN